MGFWYNLFRPSTAGQCAGSGPARKFVSLRVEALESREVLSSAENLAFVGKAYVDLLNRAADAGGLHAFSAALDQGFMTRTEVAKTLDTSPEYRGLLVKDLFLRYLHRGVDAAGLSVFTGAL